MITDTVLKTVIDNKLITAGDTVTVALSGGADSMTLLYVLKSLEKKLNITVKAAHLNHLIRGDEAFRDENFVCEECRKLGVPLVSEQIDVPQFAKKYGMSTELAARKVRYDFFSRVNEGKIATAHTASDNLETVIFNLTRGTSLDGLAGIPVKRDFYIRPLLNVTRDSVEKYCAENRISYITDSTNLSDDYTRNKLRHNVIPILKEINPAVEKSVARASFSIGEASRMIHASAEQYIKVNYLNGCLSVTKLKEEHPALIKAVIVDFIAKEHPEISLEACHINSVYDIVLHGGKTGIPCDCEITVSGGIMIVARQNEKITDFAVNPVITEENADFIKNQKKVNNLLLNNLLDCDKIVGQLTVRTRLPGDKIKLKGKGYTKPLTKLFSELKIPTFKRDTVPLISDSEGVVWIYGVGVADRAAVTDKTERVYRITYGEEVQKVK